MTVIMSLSFSRVYYVIFLKLVVKSYVIIKMASSRWFLLFTVQLIVLCCVY